MRTYYHFCSTASRVAVTDYFKTRAPNDPKLILISMRSKVAYLFWYPRILNSIHLALQPEASEVQAILNKVHLMTPQKTF